MLFYSHQVENKKQRSNSQHTIPQSSENMRLWTTFNIYSGISRATQETRQSVERPSTANAFRKLPGPLSKLLKGIKFLN